MDTWQELRRDFPALSRYVYLNSAASSPTARPVREAVTRFYREMEEEGDLFWDEWLPRREEARRSVARLIGATPEEIAFVSNTSAGMNLIVDLLEDEGRSGVLSDELEFPAVTLPWVYRGLPVHLLAARQGILHPEDFAEGRAPEAGVIAISQVQFSNGCRQDLGAFGALKGGRRLVVSGSQGVGAFPLDVRKAGVDALACAGHKWLCAGYGAGFVYLSRELLQKPPRGIGWLSVEDPFRFDLQRFRLLGTAERAELGCPSFGTIFALKAAVEYLLGIGIENISARVLALNTYLTERLGQEGFRVLSPGGAHRSGQALVELHEPARAAAFLKERRILVTEKAQGIRISTHFFNSEEDIERCLGGLIEYKTGRAPGGGVF
jgi:cysteine desulfurase / selenocysteine lyase